MMPVSDLTVAVIGGGASGMMAAMTAAGFPNTHVTLFERQQRVGKKLLSTGNGRCNLTNLHACPESYFGTDAAFAAPALQSFPPEAVLSFFRELGLLTTVEESGRVYPLSDSSNSVLDVLRFAMDRFGVEQRCSETVEDIRPTGSGFRITTGNGSFSADRVILACGGAAGTKVGGVMDGYRLGKSLGHRRSALYPSLTRILTEPEIPRALKGIRVQASLCLTENGHVLQEASGEVQFTENGISGPAGFDLSRSVSFHGSHQILHLQLLPLTPDELLTLLQSRCAALPALEVSELFTGMLQNRLGRIVVRTAGLNGQRPLSSLTEVELRAAASLCLDFPLPVRGAEGFETAQVTAGGLLTAGFRPDTLESLSVPGLFACGEVLDIDGPCGGYNLQWAWASGRLAGRLGR